MILDESAFSDVDDPGLIEEIRKIAYSHDARPAWIGGHFPRTYLDKGKDLAAWARVHYVFYMNFVGNYVEEDGAVLDLGCGAGQNTAMLARYSDRAVGVDEDNAAIEFALRHNASKRAVFLVSHFPKGEAPPGLDFDYIFCIEVIEHVPYGEQWAFLDAALGLLAPGGRLFLTTPNEERAAAPHVGIWTTQHMQEVMDRYRKNIEHRGYFSNTEPQLGFRERGSSHHALVMRRA